MDNSSSSIDVIERQSSIDSNDNNNNSGNGNRRRKRSDMTNVDSSSMSMNMNMSMTPFQKVILLLALIIFVTFRAEVPAALFYDATAAATDNVNHNYNFDANDKPEIESEYQYSNSYSYEAFNRTNPHKESWCPYAKCYNSPICTPCNRRFLFLITTGRSGSTTLLKMFNLLPHVRISGENYNELYFASQLVENIEKDKVNFYDVKTTPKNKKKNDNENRIFMHDEVKDGAFMHNAMPIGSMSCVMQKLLSTLNPPNLKPDPNAKFQIPKSQYDPQIESKMILGVKTIRLQKSPGESWNPYKAKKYLVENFPCARFVINVRSDTKGQAQSVIHAFKRDDLDDAMEDYRNQTMFLTRLASLLNMNLNTNTHGDNGDEDEDEDENVDRAKLIDMEDWKDDVSVLNDLLDWLGFENCSFPKILHENLNGYQHDNSEISLGEHCLYPHF